MQRYIDDVQLADLADRPYLALAFSIDVDVQASILAYFTLNIRPNPFMYDPLDYIPSPPVANMSEVQFAKTFLASLDRKPLKLSSDHVSDPKKYPSQSPV